MLRRALGSSATVAAAYAAWSTTSSRCHSSKAREEGGVPPSGGVRQVLTSVALNLHVNHWRVEAASSGLASDQPWSVEKRTLHGGRQEGVDVIEVDNGRLRFTVVPTRGMSIGSLEAVDAAGGGGRPSLGWASPVREYAHPAHVDLQDFKGLGWLTGFNEWCAACTSLHPPPCTHLLAPTSLHAPPCMHLLAPTLHHEHARCVRCGIAFAGHPAEEEEGGHLLTLHGRIGNTPASEVEV